MGEATEQKDRLSRQGIVCWAVGDPEQRSNGHGSPDSAALPGTTRCIIEQYAWLSSIRGAAVGTTYWPGTFRAEAGTRETAGPRVRRVERGAISAGYGSSVGSVLIGRYTDPKGPCAGRVCGATPIPVPPRSVQAVLTHPAAAASTNKSQEKTQRTQKKSRKATSNIRTYGPGPRAHPGRWPVGDRAAGQG